MDGNIAQSDSSDVKQQSTATKIVKSIIIILVIIMMLAVIFYATFTLMIKLGIIEDDMAQTLYTKLKSQTMTVVAVCFVTLFSLIIITPAIGRASAYKYNPNDKLQKRIQGAAVTSKLVVNNVDVTKLINDADGFAKGFGSLLSSF